MSNVIIDKTKLDALAVVVAEKSGESVPLTITEMTQAVSNISGGGTLQTKTKTYTPTESAQNEDVTPDEGYDGLDKVSVSVGAISSTYIGSDIPTKSSTDLTSSGLTVTAPSGYYSSSASKTLEDPYHLAENIKSGISIFGKTGTYGGSYTGIGTLLSTYSIGAVSTSSTTATTLNKSMTVNSVGNYDLLICEVSVDTQTNSRHASTINLIWMTASSAVGTKDGTAIATATLNTKLGSSGTATTRSSTTKYGIYVNSATVSSNNVTLAFYRRYNSTQTGTINGNYTARVYGVNLYNLIGG